MVIPMWILGVVIAILTPLKALTQLYVAYPCDVTPPGFIFYNVSVPI